MVPQRVAPGLEIAVELGNGWAWRGFTGRAEICPGGSDQAALTPGPLGLSPHLARQGKTRPGAKRLLHQDLVTCSQPAHSYGPKLLRRNSPSWAL